MQIQMKAAGDIAGPGAGERRAGVLRPESAVRAYARMAGLDVRCVAFCEDDALKSHFIFLGKTLPDGRPDTDASRFLACADMEAEAWPKAYSWLRKQGWAKDGMAIASDMLCAEGRLDG